MIIKKYILYGIKYINLIYSHFLLLLYDRSILILYTPYYKALVSPQTHKVI